MQDVTSTVFLQSIPVDRADPRNELCKFQTLKMQLIKPSTQDDRHIPVHLFEIFFHSFINRTTDYNLAITERESAKMLTLQCVKILAVFLLCQQAFVESAIEECSGDPEYSILGMMLQRHIYKTITGAPLGNVCLRECYRDFRCQSFNYIISKETCEMNNRTKEARPEDFVPNPDRYYFKRDMNRGK